MPAAEARAPEPDALGVNLCLVLQVRDGITDIINLFQGEQPPFRPLAPPKAAIVERQRDKPCLREDLCIIRQDPATQPGKAVAQHDPRSLLSSLQAIRQKQIPFQSCPFAKKSHSTFFHLSVLLSGKRDIHPLTTAAHVRPRSRISCERPASSEH